MLGAVYEWMDVASGKDCVELVSWESWFTAGREQLVLITGIGSPLESGGTLCTLGVPPEGTLSRCEIYTLRDKGSCDQLFDLQTCFDLLWDEGENAILTVGDTPGVFPRIGYPHFYLIRGYWSYRASI